MLYTRVCGYHLEIETSQFLTLIHIYPYTRTHKHYKHEENIIAIDSS